MLFYFDDCWVEIEFDSAWYFVFLGDDDNLVFWSSKRQIVISRSRAEAYYAVNHAKR